MWQQEQRGSEIFWGGRGPPCSGGMVSSGFLLAGWLEFAATDRI